jgi:hypothetical protein
MASSVERLMPWLKAVKSQDVTEAIQIMSNRGRVSIPAATLEWVVEGDIGRFAAGTRVDAGLPPLKPGKTAGLARG